MGRVPRNAGMPLLRRKRDDPVLGRLHPPSEKSNCRNPRLGIKLLNMDTKKLQPLSEGRQFRIMKALPFRHVINLVVVNPDSDSPHLEPYSGQMPRNTMFRIRPKSEGVTMYPLPGNQMGLILSTLSSYRAFIQSVEQYPSNWGLALKDKQRVIITLGRATRYKIPELDLIFHRYHVYTHYVPELQDPFNLHDIGTRRINVGT